MLRWNHLCGPILLIALLAPVYSQQSVPWPTMKAFQDIKIPVPALASLRFPTFERLG